MAYFLDNYPTSEECANLVLTEEQEKNCRVVYKLDDEGGACFDGFWYPKAEYSDEYVIVPIRSTGCTVVTLYPSSPFAAVKSFANVIGSGEDHLIDSKWWIELWSEKCNGGVRPNACSSDGKFYAKSGRSETLLKDVIFPYYNEAERKWNYPVSTADCSPSLVGGHILVNAEAASTAPRGSGTVHIIPICSKHNIAIAEPGRSFGTGFYMKLGGVTSALKLKGYLNGVADHLEVFKGEVRHE